MRTDRDHADIIAHEDEDGDVILEIVWPSRRLLIRCTPSEKTAGWFYIGASKNDLFGPALKWNPRIVEGKDIAALRDIIAELAAWQDDGETPAERRVATAILDGAAAWWILLGGIRARILGERHFPWAAWRYRVADGILRAQWAGNSAGVWLAERVAGGLR